MDCLDAANAWPEAAARTTPRTRRIRHMGSIASILSGSVSPQKSKRPASCEITGAPKRQRIGIHDLAKSSERSDLAREEPPISKGLEEPTSLAITLNGILDKYGDEHESLIPKRLDGIPVKTRCSVHIYYPTNECRNGTLTDIHEELLRVSQEGDVVTSWNPETGLPETKINLPLPFVIPIRELYVPKSPPAKPVSSSFDTKSEISETEDESDDSSDQGEYSLAEKYFCHFSFSTVRAPPWPPLGLDSEISRTSAIGRQLKFGHSHKRDLRLVSKMELLPSNSLSLKIPLEIKLGPDRQATQYQLALDTSWTTEEINQQEAEKPKAPQKPYCIWKIDVGLLEQEESKMDDCSCKVCDENLSSITALYRHISMKHRQLVFKISQSEAIKNEFVVNVCDKDAKVLEETLPVKKPTPVNKAIPLEPFRSIFAVDGHRSSSYDRTPEPLPIRQCHPELEQPSAQDSSTSATTSESLSKKSSPNTTPDSGSESDSESDSSLRPRKRIRSLKAQLPVAKEDEVTTDEEASDGYEAPNIVVPRTVKPLYDIATKRLLKPGEPLPSSTVSHDWRIRKQAELTASFADITLEEKDFINCWDAFIYKQRSTSKTYMPSILKNFINANRMWLDGSQSRKRELLKHLLTLTMSGRIDEICYWECLEMFQSKRISARRAATTGTKHARKYGIAREERSWIELWDAYVASSSTKSLDKFLAATKSLRSDRSMHASPDRSMLRLFLSFHNRTSTQQHRLAMDNIFYKSNYPFEATEAECEYVGYFNTFRDNYRAKDDTSVIEKLLLDFFIQNTGWLNQSIQRINWAKKQLQELHWDKQITLRDRQRLLTYLDAVEGAYDSDMEMPDADALMDSHDKEGGKEAVTPKTLTLRPALTENDFIHGPRSRKVRAFGECKCGGHARAGEAVMCAGENCVARTYHRACVTGAPPRGSKWYCDYCASTELEQPIDSPSDQLNRYR